MNIAMDVLLSNALCEGCKLLRHFLYMLTQAICAKAKLCFAAIHVRICFIGRGRKAAAEISYLPSYTQTAAWLKKHTVYLLENLLMIRAPGGEHCTEIIRIIGRHAQGIHISQQSQSAHTLRSIFCFPEGCFIVHSHASHAGIEA